MTWVFLVLAYGIIKGFREIFKKKALEKSNTIEVLFLYTFISFVLVLPEMKGAFNESLSTLAIVALKSFTIFLAWICGFKAIGQMPVSLYGILDLSRVLFSTGLGVIVLGEALGQGQIIGLIFVVIGLLLLKIDPKVFMAKRPTKNSHDIASKVLSEKDSSKKDNSERTNTFFIILAFVSAFLNAVSGTMDKYIMTNTLITDGHLQFWYMLFLVLFYLLFILVNLWLNRFRGNDTIAACHENLSENRSFSECQLNSITNETADSNMNGQQNVTDASRQIISGTGSLIPDTKKRRTVFTFRLGSSLKNYWIWILAVIFVIADRCLFIANADPNSTVTVMTLIKQSCSIVTIVAGKLVFHEKNIIHKLVCAFIIISGIIISVLW